MVPIATDTNYRGIKWYILYFIFLLYSKISIIIVKMSFVYSYYNLITKEKRILLFCNKPKTWFYMCVVDDDPTERLRCSYLCTFWFIFNNIYFLLKRAKKAIGTKIRKCTRSLKLIPHLSRRKYKCPLSCAADLLRNNTSVIECMSFVYLWFMCWGQCELKIQ